MPPFVWSKTKTVLVGHIIKAESTRNPELLFAKVSGNFQDELLQSLKDEFRKMAIAVHPDRNGNSVESKEVFSKLTAINDIAEEKIKRGLWGKSDLASISYKDRSKKVWEITDIVPMCKGDICDLYLGKLDTKTVVVKMAQSASDNDLLDAETKTLAHIWSTKHRNFVLYTPAQLTSMTISGKRANVFEHIPNAFTLAEVIKAHPDGVDPRHVAWIWRRLLEIVSWVHMDKERIHGAIIPSNILIKPADHGLVLLDWCASVPITEAVKVAVPELLDSMYPPETRDKVASGASFDIYMAGKVVMALLRGQRPNLKHVPQAFVGPALASTISNPGGRPQIAYDFYRDLDRVITKLFGPKKFIEFKMPEVGAS